MTDEERQQCYDNWQKYKWHAEDMKKEIFNYLENYKPKGNGDKG